MECSFSLLKILEYGMYSLVFQLLTDYRNENAVLGIGVFQTFVALLQVIAFFLNNANTIKYRGLMKYMPKDRSFMLLSQHDRKVCKYLVFYLILIE